LIQRGAESVLAERFPGSIFLIFLSLLIVGVIP
jgi:hypothetical protein